MIQKTVAQLDGAHRTRQSNLEDLVALSIFIRGCSESSESGRERLVTVV